MTNEDIPNLSAFDDAALDHAFAAVEIAGPRGGLRSSATKPPSKHFACNGLAASKAA